MEFMVKRALKLAQQWRWTEHKACQLAADLKVYYYCKAPFSGGSKDGKGWWEDASAGKHEGCGGYIAWSTIVLEFIAQSRSYHPTNNVIAVWRDFRGILPARISNWPKEY
jgi:hypothetical protein